MKTNNPKPFYFLSGKTQFNIVLSADHYLVYSIQKTNLSSNWNNRVIKAPNHGSSPFLYEISQNNAQLEINPDRKVNM